MILVIDPTDEFTHRLGEVGLDSTIQHVLALTDAERHLETYRDDTTAVLVGPAVDPAESLELVTKLHERYPELSIVLCLLADSSTAALRSAMRAGATDVLAWNADDGEIAEVIDRATRQTQRLREGETSDTERTSAGAVITVFSTKGGCGKSLIATSLATLLAQEAPGEVVLVDLDLQAGDDAVMLQLMPERGMREAAEMGPNLDESALNAFLTVHPDTGLKVLTAPDRPEHAEHVTPESVTHTLHLLRGMFRWVIVDGPPFFTDQVLAAFDLTDTVAVVTSMDVPSIRSLKLSMETLRDLGFSRDQLRLILNRADSKVGLTLREVEKSLGTHIDATLPSSREVPYAVNQGIPVVLSRTKAPISRALAELLETVRASSHDAAGNARRRRR